MKILKHLSDLYFILLIMFQLLGLTNISAQTRTGDWTVPTDFGQFVITVGCGGTCITDIIYTWANFHCDGITLVSGSIHSMRTGGWAITDRNFSIQTSIGTNQTITINGSFNLSGNTVSGTYSVNVYGTICAGTWGPIMSLIDINEINIPTEYFLSQNYPNPFNPVTVIKYSIPEQNFVTLKVFDTQGNEITTLVNEVKPAGSYEIKYDAANLSSGIYFYKIQSGNYSQMKKMMLLK
jgi:hypothetical protein